MAKTTYNQITKGDVKGAQDFAKAAKNLQKIAGINKTKLANLKTQYNQSAADIAAELQRGSARLLVSHDEAGANYLQLGKDNESAESDNSFSNLANMRRERAQTLDQVLSQGGGETDLLKAQGVALRNWNSNQQDTNRSFADTLTSINNSISDSNQQSLANLTNLSEDSDKALRQAFNELQAGEGSILGEQTDLYGQVANLYGQGSAAARTTTAKTVTTGTKNQKTTQSQGVKETKLSKSYTKQQDKANADLVKTAKQLADINKQTYTSDVKSAEDLGYVALQKQTGEQNTNDQANAQTLTKIEGPEGATLRKW